MLKFFFYSSGSLDWELIWSILFCFNAYFSGLLLIPPHPPLLPSLQDEQSAMLMLKRHMVLKQVVDDYAYSIRKLSDRAQKMFTEDHPDGFVLL